MPANIDVVVCFKNTSKKRKVKKVKKKNPRKTCRPIRLKGAKWRTW